jgi:hypothetical protein
MQPLEFRCFCGGQLRADPKVTHGKDEEGRVLSAGLCPEHGWVGSDGTELPVPVQPLKEK